MLMAAHWIELNLTATEGVPVLGAEVVGTAVVGGSEGALVGCEVGCRVGSMVVGAEVVGATVVGGTVGGGVHQHMRC